MWDLFFALTWSFSEIIWLRCFLPTIIAVIGVEPFGLLCESNRISPHITELRRAGAGNCQKAEEVEVRLDSGGSWGSGGIPGSSDLPGRISGGLDRNKRLPMT